MWKRKVGSTTFDWASLVSIKHFQRLCGLIQDLRGHINTNEKIAHADSLAYVKQLIELDNYWAASGNDIELRWFISYQDYIHQVIREHIISSIANSMMDARSEFHNWLNKGNPLQVVATTSLGSYHNSDRLQAHL
ncbi:hypothetical protein PPACK8108_LOCUS12314 [Phakopsora pachyrhizi]|uniref:Uncharacterized protein n=1 Tax=Phakopsora pachyrhizi TaxID=170000 RepID=A0AAV0B1L1_PHAPC|nr:hypothetical protein PPACK8108_LOCUS12314 [Phakopsora pachyrhizi]